MAWNIEVTDTFCGEANYSWVRRYTIPSRAGESRLAFMRRAKAAAGLNGVRGSTYWHGDSADFRSHGACVVAFVQWIEPAEAFDPEDAEPAE